MAANRQKRTTGKGRKRYEDGEMKKQPRQSRVMKETEIKQGRTDNCGKNK